MDAAPTLLLVTPPKYWVKSFISVYNSLQIQVNKICKQRHPSLFFIYRFGLFLCVILMGIAIWGDYEASSYGFPRRASEQLRGLSCPILMTFNEEREISLSISNPLDREIHPSVRVELSTDSDPVVFIESVDIAPGESQKMKWAVDSKNVDLGNFIFASVQVYGMYPMPSRQSTCGIFVIDLPLSGSILLSSILVFGLAGMAAGLYGMDKFGPHHNSPANLQLATRFLSALIVIGLVTSFMGIWLPSLVLLVVTLLGSFLIFGAGGL